MKKFVGHEEFHLQYAGGKRWIVRDGFTYWHNKLEYVDVPSGFVTDFASVPRLLKALWPSPGGKWDLPAVVHDKAYKDGYVRNIYGGKRAITRAEGDQMFRDGMEAQGVRETAEAWFYLGVRLGGWWAWNKHRKRDGKIKKAA